jgi:hypothetical protein
MAFMQLYTKILYQGILGFNKKVMLVRKEKFS